jgi:hypothetical protein
VLNCIQTTGLALPSNTPTGRPVEKSHNLTDPSVEDDATRLPSRLDAMERTSPS